MNLRDLYEKAAEEWTKSDDDRPGMEWNCTVESEYGTVCFMANDVADPEYSHNNAALIVALHNCADELLRVAELSEELMESNSRYPSSDYTADIAAKLVASLAALREKEGKI